MGSSARGRLIDTDQVGQRAMEDETVRNRIRAEIARNDVVLFMKGTPQIPQYGFSAAVTEILSHLGVAFTGVNVLEDDAIVRASRSFPTGRPFHSFM